MSLINELSSYDSKIEKILDEQANGKKIKEERSLGNWKGRSIGSLAYDEISHLTRGYLLDRQIDPKLKSKILECYISATLSVQNEKLQHFVKEKFQKQSPEKKEEEEIVLSSDELIEIAPLIGTREISKEDLLEQVDAFPIVATAAMKKDLTQLLTRVFDLTKAEKFKVTDDRETHTMTLEIELKIGCSMGVPFVGEKAVFSKNLHVELTENLYEKEIVLSFRAGDILFGKKNSVDQLTLYSSENKEVVFEILLNKDLDTEMVGELSASKVLTGLSAFTGLSKLKFW